jgi:demethylmenaquinone methyltransferase/2-methoxy-6-polyprenyl-1,4-benzoquinol methylase
VTDRDLLNEQVAYYRARAPEYDEWFFRQGRYDRGERHRAEWFEEVSGIEAALRSFLPDGDILELACGTGLWTRHLLAPGRRILAVDASPEMLALNQARIQSDAVEYIAADLFDWTPPPGRFDAVFFAFWLSHVPLTHADSFWQTVRAALKPAGVVFFVDNLLEPTSPATDQSGVDASGTVRRRLNDGRQFQIVKVFHDPGALERDLARMGWRVWIRPGKFFLYGRLALG